MEDLEVCQVTENDKLLQWLKGKTSAEKCYLLHEIAHQMKELNHEDKHILKTIEKLNLKTTITIQRLSIKDLTQNISSLIDENPDYQCDTLAKEEHNIVRKKEDSAHGELTAVGKSQLMGKKRARECIEEEMKREVKKISGGVKCASKNSMLKLHSNHIEPLIVDSNCELPVSTPPLYILKACQEKTCDDTYKLNELSSQMEFSSNEATSTGDMPLQNTTESKGESSNIVSDSTVSSSNTTDYILPEEDIDRSEIPISEISHSVPNTTGKRKLLMSEIISSTSKSAVISGALNLYSKYFDHFPIPEEIQAELEIFVGRLENTANDNLPKFCNNKQGYIRAFFNIYLTCFNDDVFEKVNRAAEILHLFILDVQRKKDRLDRSSRLSSENLKYEEIKEAHENYRQSILDRRRKFRKEFSSLLENVQDSNISFTISLFFRITQSLFQISSDNIQHFDSIRKFIMDLLRNDDLITTSLDYFFHLKRESFICLYTFSKRCLVSLYHSGYKDLATTYILKVSHQPPCPINLGEANELIPCDEKPAEESLDITGINIKLDTALISKSTTHDQLSKQLEPLTVQQKAIYDEISAKRGNHHQVQTLETISFTPMSPSISGLLSTPTRKSKAINNSDQIIIAPKKPRHEHEQFAPKKPRHKHEQSSSKNIVINNSVQQTVRGLNEPTHHHQLNEPSTSRNITNQTLPSVQSKQSNLALSRQLSLLSQAMQNYETEKKNNSTSKMHIPTTDNSSVISSIPHTGNNVFSQDHGQNIGVGPAPVAAHGSRSSVNLMNKPGGCSPLAIMAQSQMCEANGCSSSAILKCSLCYNAFYCTVQCQNTHWYEEHYGSCRRTHRQI